MPNRKIAKATTHTRRVKMLHPYLVRYVASPFTAADSTTFPSYTVVGSSGYDWRSELL
jgi:hypothetical protein